MSLNFEKGVQVSPQLIEFFIDDMLENLISFLTPEQFFNVCLKYNFTCNSDDQTYNASFQSKYSIMNYYILAMNKYFSYDEITTKQYQNFVNMASEEINTGRISPQNMSRTLANILFQFTTPLYSFFQACPLGYDSDIDAHLSLLPPLIRYYVLSDLYGQIAVKIATGEPIDINHAVSVIDRLNLAILKISDSQTAFNWVNENSDLFTYLDMYDTCMSKVHAFANRPVDYTTFNETLPFYNKNWRLPYDTDSRQIFTNIVEFYYNSPRHAAMLLVSDL